MVNVRTTQVVNTAGTMLDLTRTYILEASYGQGIKRQNLQQMSDRLQPKRYISKILCKRCHQLEHNCESNLPQNKVKV